MNDLNDIGTRIKELREEKKLTQAELANLIGCKQTTVASWESRKGRIPNKKLIENLSEVLQIEIDYLLGINGVKRHQIKYDQEICEENFIWQKKQDITIGDKFALQISGDFLEPIASKGDKAIFRKEEPKDTSIVVITFPSKKISTVRMWRQKNQYVMLTDINIEESKEPYFFEIADINEKTLECKLEKCEDKVLIVEGKLVLVQKNPKYLKTYLGIKYNFP